MHDPIDIADTPKDASELNDQQEEKKEKEESGDTKTKSKLNGGSEPMGFQTQQNLLNGGNDVDMADAEGGASSDHSSDGDAKAQQSARPNGEGNKAKVHGLKEVVDNGQQQAGDSKENKSKPPDSNGSAKAPASAPPPPVLRGTLSYNSDLRRHLIRGMWNYENSNAFPPQRFELLRNLDPGEDPTVLPKDGEFHGSFSLAYFHTTSKGKQKERSKVIPESGVYIKFTPVEGGEEGNFKVDGKGTNQFGIFHINGTAEASPHDDDPSYNIVLRKRYEPSAPAAGAASVDATPVEKEKKMKKRKLDESEEADALEDAGPFPPSSQSYEKNVVCLRGKLYKEESEDVGVGEVVHRINGMWSSGLDLILADPQNAQGLCNRFEYEHKSSFPSQAFPISGRYSGWFDLSQEDGTRARINERDITLRFRRNDAGGHNIEGKGSNVFGKYSITGTLNRDHVITIFRHFQPRKIKASKAVTSAPPPINAPGQARRPSLPAFPEPQLKFDEVKVPEGEEPFEPLKPPEHPTYSAVSRGILRLNEDGSHSCQGKWAVTREHFTNGQTSNFTFRLEAHFVADAAKNTGDRPFPLDSEMYKGSFQLKKGGSRYQSVVDQQIVMKFRKNSAGSYNVYGKGINGIGGFNLTGTLIMSGKTGGQVEVYRMYPPELLAATPAAAKTPGPLMAASKTPPLPKPVKASDPLPADLPLITPNIAPSSSTMLPGPRRESTRLVKVPSRLEDDDPMAQLNRIMEKCNQILRFMREKDVERGAFFSEPVDPVALGIPTYHTIVSEPMDLRTLHRKMEAEEVETPEDFARLSRLVFENAMTFNVDPTHSVHQAARNLLILFNQKYRDVERMVTNIRRLEREGGKKGKDDKKRKRGDEPKSLRRMRLEEAQDMAAMNARSIEAIVAAASSAPSTTVSRNEFSLMLQMMQQLEQQVVQTYTALAELSSDDLESGSGAMPLDLSSMDGLQSSDMISLSSAPDKKVPKRKVEEPKIIEKPVVEDDTSPLTLAEQELLTDTINELHADHLHGVIHIIREAAKLTGEEDEIDLEIDQLDTATQRQLLRHVSKFIKKPKQAKAKAPRKKAPAQSKKTEKPAPVKKTAKAALAKPKADPDSFFAFGSNEDSDSDSDDGEISSPAPAPAPAPAVEEEAPTSPAAAASTSKDAGFTLGGLGAESDDEDEDEDEDAGVAASWNISKESTESKKEGDDDDAWGAAREEAAAVKARELDKKKREEKMKAEAEEMKKQRMAEAAARGEEIRAQRMEEEEKEALLQEEKEKEAEEQRKAAREAARAQVQSVEQTVDLDAQRDIMKQYEQSFLDKELGSASPSSDFGF